MEANGELVDLPECSAPFIINRLLDIGIVTAGGFGAGPISWRDLVAWQTCTGTPLPPWQARMLVELSREYCAFSVDAEKPDCVPPWAELAAVTEDRRARVARDLRIGFKALIMAKASTKSK